MPAGRRRVCSFLGRRLRRREPTTGRTREVTMGGPLVGLRVVDLSTTLAGAHVSQTLADFGCDVVMIEPPGGSPLRSQPAWPFWGRGKRSVVLDLHRPSDAETARSLAAGADVVVETWRPGVADRLGLGYDELATVNPRLVHASISGFGRGNRWSHLKAYDQIVLAKIGGLDAFSGLSERRGPSYVASPYCSFSAAQLALQGILAALYEREGSGRGQRVETNLVLGILAHDTWNWLIRKIVAQYADAFAPATPVDQKRLVPNTELFYRLMVGYSKDGRYLQFSQTTERLWQAFLRVTGLGQVMQERPGWADAITSEDDDIRVAFWEEALTRTRSRTYDEWLEVFDAEPDVWAEMFRHNTELLHHPQMVHDRRTVVIDDPAAGAVLQPGPLVQMAQTPAELGRPAPAPDEHAAGARADADTARDAAAVAAPPLVAPARPPLAGVTVVELGTFYAAPFGATMLTDLGARVVKVEQLDGDPIRNVIPFPEIAGIKVLQGKESVAVDMTSPRGREIVLELVRRADVVMQSFRAGVAERHRFTAADLLAVNPDLVYVNAPGYGTSGPCGARPAFAPTIGAGSGLAYRNLGGVENVPQGPELTMEEVKRNSMRMSGATMILGHADGFASLGVGTSLVLGLLAKRRGAPGQELSTSMLSTLAHALSEDMVEYENRAPLATPDKDLYGMGPRFRLYETAEGWVFLAAPEESDWAALAGEMDLDDSLRADDAALAAALETRFRQRAAADWESTLTKVDVACAEVVKGPVEEVIWFSGGMGEALGIVTDQTHAVIGDYQRLRPMVRFSRCTGVAGPAPALGEHTDAVLRELGYDDSGIDALRRDNVVGG
jgi:crotonobetainyl-CoA:carnitine CoA-transferase CaiB-like acyl-CoA transferase